jgi:hypothetical protein
MLGNSYRCAFAAQREPSPDMHTLTEHAGQQTACYPPLEAETRPAVDTATAAHWLSRKPQTLRVWALTGHPIKPRRVNGRLSWPVSEIRRLLGVDA